MLRAMQQDLASIDVERAAALDVLLLLADTRAGWAEYERALDLLEDVENAVGVLPPEYVFKRRAWLAELP